VAASPISTAPSWATPIRFCRPPTMSTATKYRNTTTVICHSAGLCGTLPCSATNMAAAAGSSGRRGRRFKSCHPDRVSAGQRPAPEMVRASSLPVQQQNTASTATTTRYDPSVGALPSAWFALRAGRRDRRRKICHLDQSSRRPSLKSRRPVVTGELQVDNSFGRSRLPIGGGGQGGLVATVRAEMTSSNGGTPDNPAGVA
jgi:hypothetical protein